MDATTEFDSNYVHIKLEPIELAIEYDVLDDTEHSRQQQETFEEANGPSTSPGTASEGPAVVKDEPDDEAELPNYDIDVFEADIKEESEARDVLGSGTKNLQLNCVECEGVQKLTENESSSKTSITKQMSDNLSRGKMEWSFCCSKKIYSRKVIILQPKYITTTNSRTSSDKSRSFKPFKLSTEEQTQGLQDSCAIKNLTCEDPYLVKPHTCQECGKSFCYSSNLHTHMKIHTAENVYTCSECGKKFCQLVDLKKHTRVHFGDKPYSCQECGKTYAHAKSLRIHMNVHSVDKPPTCLECGKSFSNPSNLRTHMSIHTGEKPYPCQECSKSFRQLGSLQKHLRIHTGEKPYCCLKCDKSFAQVETLRTHMITHVAVKPHTCRECGKSFSHLENLHSHTCPQLVKLLH